MKSFENYNESGGANVMVVTMTMVTVETMYMREVTIITKVVRMEVDTQRR